MWKTGQVIREFQVPHYVLEYWVRTGRLSPIKDGSGDRIFRQEDIDVIRKLLAQRNYAMVQT